MELQIKLKFEKDQPFAFDSHILQGIFLSIIGKEHSWEIWDFSFSNIHFEKDFYRAGKLYNLTFRCVKESLFFLVFEKLIELKNKTISFWAINNIIIESVKPVLDQISIYTGKKIKSETPIIITLDKRICDKFNILCETDSLFFVDRLKNNEWKETLYFDVFNHQLKKNLVIKYIKVLKASEKAKSSLDQVLINLTPDGLEDYVKKLNFFSSFKFIWTRAISYKNTKFYWTKFEFIIGDGNLEKQILKTVINLGFWEKSTAGFWFIN